jgi:hypothetical protein
LALLLLCVGRCFLIAFFTTNQKTHSPLRGLAALCEGDLEQMGNRGSYFVVV